MRSVNPNTGIKGTDVVLANLNREIVKIKAGSMAGLIEASIMIRRDMDKTSPLIPIGRTENLRASWFTTPHHTAKGPGLKIGFGANYAVFVHEMVDRGKKINWSRPGSGPKFLETALKRNHKQVLKIIGTRTHIKP